jgi:hypothetical protein
MDKRAAAIIEAVRLARLELDCYRDPACRATSEWTVNRLTQLLLDDPAISQAMAELMPEAEAPSLAPDHYHDLEAAHRE